MKILYGMIAAFCLYTNNAAANQTIHLSNGEWPPYLSATLPHYGVGSYLVSQAFAAVGIDVEYDFFPWKRSFLYGKEGIGASGHVWNGTLLWIFKVDRAQDFLYSDIVLTDSQVLFFLKDRPFDWQNIEDLKGKTLGGTAHTAYPRLEEAARQGILSINRGSGYADLFKRLFAYRIDAIPNVKRVGAFYIRTSLSAEQQNRITYSPNVLEVRDYYLILSKKIKGNKRLITLFNQGLKIIKDNGIYEQAFIDLHLGKFDPLGK